MNINIELRDDKTDAVMVIDAVLARILKNIKKRTPDSYTTQEIYHLSAFVNKLAQAADIRMEAWPHFMDILSLAAKWIDAREAEIQRERDAEN
jgi:hypothetical protein